MERFVVYINLLYLLVLIVFKLNCSVFIDNFVRLQVLKIECETRKGPLDFVTCMRNALAKYFGDEIVSKYSYIIVQVS